MLDSHKVAIGRAVISRSLGGARLTHSVDSLVAALAEAFQLDRAKPAEQWPDYVAAALAEVDSALEIAETHKAQLEHAKGVETVLRRDRDAAQARCNNAEMRESERLADCLIFAAESDELREVLAPLASILATLPLAVLASTDDAGKLASLYLKAEVLTSEPSAERLERLRRKLESGQ